MASLGSMLLGNYFSSFPAEWIRGKKYPNGIPYNTELSPNDQKLIRQFYGPPRKPSADNASPVATLDK